MSGIREKILPPSGHSFRLLKWDRSLGEVDSVIAPDHSERIMGAGNRWHFHTEIELTLILRGQGTRFVGDDIGPFTDGDLVLLGERLPHYWHTKGVSKGISLQFHFPEDHAFWGFPENEVARDLFKRACHGLAIQGKAAQVISQLMQELVRNSGAARLGILLIILARLGDASGRDLKQLSASAFNLPNESPHEEEMARAVRFLIANFKEEVRLEDLLKLTGMSRPTFARQFKKHSGHCYSGFLNQLRLQAACRRLEDSEQTILDISLACGFPQVSFFNRVFRREMKCSPSEFRRTIRSAAKGSKPKGVPSPWQEPEAFVSALLPLV